MLESCSFVNSEFRSFKAVGSGHIPVDIFESVLGFRFVCYYDILHFRITCRMQVVKKLMIVSQGIVNNGGIDYICADFLIYAIFNKALNHHETLKDLTGGYNACIGLFIVFFLPS